MNRPIPLISCIGFFLIIGLIISLGMLARFIIKEKAADVCSTPGCIHTASRILKDMNTEIKPCDDFYEFACGGYIASTLIPGTAYRVDRYSDVDYEIQNQLRLSLEEPSSPDEGRLLSLAKTLYRSCMNTSAIEEAGLEPIREIINRMGKWPVIEGETWDEDDFDWTESVYRSRKLGYPIDNFISLSVEVDSKNSSKYTLALNRPEFYLPSDPLSWKIEIDAWTAYYEYMIDIAVFLGANETRATEELRETLGFHSTLADIPQDDVKTHNYTLMYNPVTISALRRQYPSVNWEKFINNLLPSTVRVNGDDVVIVSEPKFISDLEEILKNTSKRVQANYAVWKVVMDSVQFLTKDMRQREMEFIATRNKNIITDSEPRWKECVGIVSRSSLSFITSSIYVRDYFKKETKQSAMEMADNIRKAMVETLKKADWMDEATRSRAVEKAESVLSLIAYPVELLDDKELEKFYLDVKLKINPDDFLGNILKSNKFLLDRSLGLLRKPVTKSNWDADVYVTEINSFYYPFKNSFVILAGDMQGTYFSDDRPHYLNYGATGFGIGHEISHGFDTNGRQLGKDGNLVDWWAPKTAEKYLEKVQCLIDQYGNYTVESVGRNVNGNLTVSENIADNSGIKTAYLAYKEYVRRNGPEPKLPGLKYTPEEMFWISAANTWCSKYRPETELDETDTHSPARFRVIGSFRNLPEFAADFKCESGSYMNPVHKCSLF